MAYVVGLATGVTFWLHCSELPRRSDVDALEPGDGVNFTPVLSAAGKSPEAQAVEIGHLTPDQLQVSLLSLLLCRPSYLPVESPNLPPYP